MNTIIDVIKGKGGFISKQEITDDAIYEER